MWNEPGDYPELQKLRPDHVSVNCGLMNDDTSVLRVFCRVDLEQLLNLTDKT